MGDRDRPDFFISFTSTNETWARWIAVELEQAGYRTVSQTLDFRPGQDFVHAMHRAVSAAARTLAVLSPAYVASEFGEAEWRSAFAADPSGESGLLIPVRVQPCDPPGLLRTRIHIDLVDADERTARRRLLDGVAAAAPRSASTAFPGGPPRRRPADPPEGERFPGAGPEVSNLPWRNRGFTGRDELLQRLHDRLRDATLAAVLPVEAVHGLGGIGKTELVLEFAHRFSSDYDVVWLVAAEQPTVAAADLAALARRLGAPATADQSAAIEHLFDLLRERTRWLLIYDNAEHPTALRGLLPPAGRGNVLVTSRWAAWSRLAEPLRLDVLARAESVRFLGSRVPTADTAELDDLAELLGDLPLALDEAAAYLEATNLPLSDYLRLVRHRVRELFDLAPQHPRPAMAIWTGPDADQRRVATTWSVSLEKVRAQAPLAEKLLALCALLAPEIPRSMFVEHASALPGELASVVRDPIAYNAMLASIGLYSLAAVGPSVVGLHRLVQAVIRARLAPAEEREWARAAVVLLRAAFPDDTRDARRWADCEQALPHVLAAAAHAERLGVAGEPVGWLYGHAAAYLRARGQYRRALALSRRAVELTEAALGPEHIEVAARREELGLVLWNSGELAQAREQVEAALRTAVRVLGPDHPDVGTTRSHLGLVLQDVGDLPAARAEHEHALRISENALGPEHPDVGTRRNNLGLVLRAQGDLDGARAQFERALEIGERTAGPDDLDIATRRNNLALVLRSQGRLAEARTHYERALRICEAVLGPWHPKIGTLRNNLGGLLRAMGDLAGARTELDRALRISENALGPGHLDVAVVRNSLGLALFEAGDLDAARAEHEHALRISEDVLGPDHPDVGARRMSLGRVIHAQGDVPAARAEYERALTISTATLGAGHPQVAAAREALDSLA
ncbi:FxSxx-COOH system tetratricopeptide repeat protein [Pseudonocardia humida]|uniref:Tetratricopeptide repeat protein n=1 Tax=Pseudonocardia humida TaxID=2800819 RepID=A0ABT0ZSD7_9PSEU|nr:FxSxx-COOH system tetratricopeptide repeat protein [Pseudonocardia humida]MCO1653631.1 tetratricopeptide repeat protein [Pseudonocardia humida]